MSDPPPNGSETQDRGLAELLARTGRDTFELFAQTVNRTAPPHAPPVSAEDAAPGDSPGEFRWTCNGWMIHFWLTSPGSVEIRWCSPEGRIFEIAPDGSKRSAASVDDPRAPSWPQE